MPIDTGTLGLELAALAFLGALGCMFLLWRTRRALDAQRHEVRAQLTTIHDKLADLAVQASKPHPPLHPVAHVTPVASPSAASASTQPSEQDELLAAVTAAAAAIAQRKLRIQSIRQVHPEPEPATAWSQQGRVVVQSSHNVGPHR